MLRTGRSQTDGRSRDEIIAADVADLYRLGYAQELFRAMGGFSNIAISFSIVSILTGAVILYGYGLTYGGPGINGWGWPLVSLFPLLIAAATAEIASAYPTAGGLYDWTSRLGNRHWGWWTAWLNLGGLVTAVAGYILLLAITYALPPITATLDAEAAGTPSVASTGRMIYAFARDGGVPASTLFSHVSPRYLTPDVALLTAGLLAVAICAYAYTTVDVIKALGLITGMSTNLLYWAYGIPILLGLRNPEWRPRSVWRPDRYSRPAATLALTWIAIISILFLWWPNNTYTVQGTATFAAPLLVYYFAWARFRFAGPRARSTAELRHREQLVGEAPVVAD